MTRPYFTKERVTDFDIFDRHANDAIGQVADRLAAGYPIDFQVSLLSITRLILLPKIHG
jgi:hypothetical protein